MKVNAVKNSIISLIAGDMIGTPIQFILRKNLEEDLKKYSIQNIVENNKNKNLPLGVWSDDSSMTLCTIKSIIDRNEIDIEDITKNFIKWFKEGYLTPQDRTFDVGHTTFVSLSNILHYIDYQNWINQENNQKYKDVFIQKSPTGLDDIRSNGNGSLMRILPASLYCYFKDLSNKETFEVIKNVSSITHAHQISVLACYIYTKIIFDILNNKNKDEIIENLKNIPNNDGIPKEYITWLDEFQRIISGEIINKTKEELKSTGYVINTLEVALWGFYNTSNIEDCIYEICKLGFDTDTNAAVGGGLSGLYYGLKNENLSDYLINKIIKKEMIIDMINKFINKLREKGGLIYDSSNT